MGAEGREVYYGTKEGAIQVRLGGDDAKEIFKKHRS